MNPILHFVYSVPESTHPLYYRWDKYALKYRLFPPSYRNAQNVSWPKPIAAPFSITYHLVEYLKKHYDIKLYDWKEKGIIKNIQTEDILLFHPTPDFQKWKKSGVWHIDINSISYKTLQKYPKTTAIIIIPYTHFNNQSLWLEPLLKKITQKAIFICGNYWTDSWIESPYYSLMNNIPLQINMGIDTYEYPIVKKKLNPIHSRKFLYIGNTNEEKNILQLEAIATYYRNFKGGYISSGEIKGWNKISNFAHLTPKFMEELSQEYDFFLSTSIADAQATTILEQMCFGMGIACTPESGYSYSSIIKLHTHDTSYNCQQVQRMQEMTEEEYFSRVELNLQNVKTVHNWVNICKKVHQYIKNL